MAERYGRSTSGLLGTARETAEQLASGQTIEPGTVYDTVRWEIHVEEDHVSYFDFYLDEWKEMFRAPIEAIKKDPELFIQLIDEAQSLIGIMDMLQKKPRIYITDKGKFRCIYWSDNELVFDAEWITMTELGFERDNSEWVLDADTYQKIQDALTALGVPKELQKIKFRRLNF